MAYNTINGLFHIPDEGSFLKKLILANKPAYNKDVKTAFKYLSQQHKNIELIEEENYAALMLPTVSPGVKLEAMFITTFKEGKKLLSIYHRLHFDEHTYGKQMLIEADAFLRMSAVVINLPVDDRLEGIAYLMNYQIQEALNIEITMLTLSDSNPDIAKENILPFVMNSIGRYMLACSLDGVEYNLPATSDDLARMVADYCDVPLVTALTGVGALADYKSDIEKSELAFISEYASSTSCMMFLYVDNNKIDQFLDKGFKIIKSYLLDAKDMLGLETVVGDSQTLNQFQRINLDEIRDDIAENLDRQKEAIKEQNEVEAFRLKDML
jgi:hypothetical protein